MWFKQVISTVGAIRGEELLAFSGKVSNVVVGVLSSLFPPQQDTEAYY